MSDNYYSALIFEFVDRDGFAQAIARVKAIDPSDNEVTYRYDLPAADLEVYSSGSADYKDYAFTSFKLQVDNSGAIDVFAAERIYKLLAKTNKALEKVRDNYGDASSFGVYVQRVAKVLGINAIGFYPPNGQSRWSSGYRLRFDNPQSAAYTIDRIIREWKEPAEKAA